MLHTLVGTLITVVVVVGGFMVISVIRDKFMGPEAPKYFQGCDSCGSCGMRETCDGEACLQEGASKE